MKYRCIYWLLDKAKANVQSKFFKQNMKRSPDSILSNSSDISDIDLPPDDGNIT